VSQKFGGNEWMLANQTSVGPKRDKQKDTLGEDAAVE